MKLPSKEEYEFVNAILIALFSRFFEPLFEMQAEKNYYTHVGTVAQMVEWSHEFYRMHNENNKHSATPSTNGAIPLLTPEMQELLLAFGQQRIALLRPKKAGREHPVYNTLREKTRA
jgi:hypothetical protein